MNPYKHIKHDKMFMPADQEIAEARDWLTEHPPYTMRFDLCNKHGGVTVQGVNKETKEILAVSRGSNLAKHINRVLKQLKDHAGKDSGRY